jgi:hypothetical protein
MIGAQAITKHKEAMNKKCNLTDTEIMSAADKLAKMVGS